VNIPELLWWQWALAAGSGFFAGVAKTGVPGLGILMVPLMVIAVGDARESAGWLLPMLCTADLFAVFYWRRHAQMEQLVKLAPWALAGMAGGAAALSLPEGVLRPMVGGIIFVMLGVYLWRRRRGSGELPAHPVLYGTAAGFSTTVANAAGPVMNLYLLSMRLPKEEFLGTGAWFFFLINLSKLPIYVFHGLITVKSLTINVLVLPAVVLGALTGRQLVKHIPMNVFEAVVLGLTVLSTLALFR
jgi:uncharacterized protein